jgi:hypothetical protein
MKNIFLTILGTILIPFSVKGQAPTGFYAKVAGNYTSLNSPDLITSADIGYGYGITFNMGYHETYNYQVEFSSNRGFLNFKTLDQTFENVSDSKIAYTNFNAGFYFNYYVLKPDEDTFFIGPQAGISFTFAADFENTSITDEQYYYLPYRLNDNSFDFPKVLPNVGIGLTGGYNNLRFDLRYELGFGNVLEGTTSNKFNENNIYIGPSFTGKINTLSFGVSYLILSTNKR